MFEQLEEITAQEQQQEAGFEHRVKVCVAAGCLSSQSQAVLDALREEVKEKGQEESCQVKGVGCMGLCSKGPLASVCSKNGAGEEETTYHHVRASDTAEIVAALGNKPVKRLVLATDIPFFQRQTKIVLENSGIVDPERIEDYVAREGYQALFYAISEMSPAEVIDEVVRSGLRGRGGGGYPTGLKWTTVAKSEGVQKYVICNADEGDPGAFMDRSVLESDPHRILEGMAIAGYAVGASRGYIYVRGEYPLAVERLKIAIRQARRLSFLGSEICGTRFQLSCRDSPRRRRLCLRRRDGADRLDRREARPAPAPPTLPGGIRPLGRADADQQCRDFRQRCPDYSQRRRLVCADGHEDEQGHQGLRPGRRY